MKDISDKKQPSFLLMKIDENGDKHWRLNYNVIETKTEEGDVQYECDFAPVEGGIISEIPSFELFVDELKTVGLTDIEIDVIRDNVQL